MTVRRIRAALLGASATETVFLICVCVLVIAFLAVGSNVKGLGFDNCQACFGPPGGEYLTLNPAFFLPFVLADRYTGIQIGTRGIPTIADFFAYHPNLYAWTIVWWFLLAYMVARASSAAGFWLPRQLSIRMRSH